MFKIKQAPVLLGDFRDKPIKPQITFFDDRL